MKRVFFFAVSLLILFSCQAELDQLTVDSPDVFQPVTEESSVVFHASTESYSIPDTRVYADEDMKVLWNADDRISIFKKTTYNYQYKFLGEDGDTAGDFDEVATSGFHTGGSVDYFYAVYPYRTSNKLNNQGVFTVVLPSEQTYKANSFGIGSNTMVAVSDGDFIAFKNVCGYLSISLWGDDVSVSKVTLQGKNGEKIAGKASVSMPLGGLPSTTMDGTATETITIECNPALKIGTSKSDCTTFWFAIPPVTFSGGITMTIEDDKGGVCTKSASTSIEIKRNTVDRMGVLKVTPNYSIVTFADDNFKAYCLDKFDNNDDGKITSDEASAVKSIDVCTDDIESLGGVESFTNLESLKCTGSGVATRGATDYNGQLTNLDVSALTKLKELDCRDNQLQTLDVSSNLELNTLICTKNPMSEIKMAVGQEVPQLECPEDTEIVHEWGDGIGPEKFPDEVFRDHVFVNYDTDGDGFLSDAECNAVKQIVINTDNIISLQGIEFFPSIQTLRCKGSASGKGKLANLDVSNNVALSYLECINNQLTKLDLSNNPNLQRLYCYDNQLPDLDLSGCPALVAAYCDNNQLTNLVVPNNGTLKELLCNGNQLQSLDVSNNEGLTTLYCGANQITSLDVSNNPALQYLYCYDNQLTSIDLSNNPLLEQLHIDTNSLTALDISANEALLNLYCGYNQLKSLDVSNNTALKVLVCNFNQLTQLDVSNNVLLDMIWCNGNQLTNLDVSGNLALETLTCNENSISTLYVRAGHNIDIGKDESTIIVEIVPIEDPGFLHRLLLWYDSDKDGKFTTVDAEAIDRLDFNTFEATNMPGVKSLQGIEYMPNLKYIWACGSRIYDYGNGNVQVDGLLDNLDISHNPALTELYCYANVLNTLDVSNNPNLKVLVCYANRLTDLNVSNNAVLERLDLKQNLLTELDVTNNAKLDSLACERNPNMTTLYMNAGQSITTLSKDDATVIVYNEGGQATNEIWYTTSDGEAVTYTVTPDTGNTIDESGCVAPKDNAGVGIIKFTAPLITIDDSGMNKQTNLTSVSLPDRVETIGLSAFEYCSSLTEVHLGSSLKTIGAWAFGSTALGDIDFLPEGLVRIGAGAFEEVQATTVVIPETVEYLGTYTKGDTPMGSPFDLCSNLKSFSGKFATVDGKALVETAPDGDTYLISYALGVEDDSYVIPKVDAITCFAFWGSSLSYVELPSSLKRIYDGAFLSCKSLKSVTIPSGIQGIGGEAFGSCSNLESIRIESSVVPSNIVTYYRGQMFRSSTCDILVPASSVEAYKSATYWSDYADRIKPIS